MRLIPLAGDPEYATGWCIAVPCPPILRPPHSSMDCQLPQTGSCLHEPVPMTDCRSSAGTVSGLPATQVSWTRSRIALVAPVVITLLDRLDRLGSSLLVHGLRDEIGHALTAYLWALGLMALRLPLTLPMVVLGGILIDVDHLLQFYGVIDAAPGSSRPGSHSLVTLVIILLVASGDRRRSWMWISFAVGFLSHLVRDMATGTVPLLWPRPADPVSIPYDLYTATLAACAVVAFGRVLVDRMQMRKASQ